MTDEEKKAIQYLNKYCDTDLLYEQRHYNYIKMIIRLVGKQSKEIEELKFKYQARKDRMQKEIEELKKPKYIIDLKTNEITTLNNDFVSKDKIKAKIEYLLKRYDSEEDFCSYDVVLSILQSLLE